MFAMSRKDLKPAYTCGTYHRRGRQGCTSHHIRVDRLDFLVKLYLDKILKNAGSLLERLNGENLTEEETPIDMEESIKNLSLIMEDLQEELKVTKRQRIRDIMKHPGQEALLEQTYNEMEAELQQRIAGVQNQITLVADRRSTMERVNRAAQTAWQVFEGILQKESLERPDLELILQQIRVFEDHLEIQLKPDIDGILRSNFEENEAITFLQTAKNHENREFFTNIISDGDPLEIYTEKDGEVIFKKYSPMGDLQDFAAQLCDSIGKNTGHIAAVADRDSIIAVAGAPKRELLEKRNSPELEQLMEQRKNYRYRSGEARLRPAEAVDRYHLGVAAPIIAEGDLMGCVMLLLNENDQEPTESEQKLAQTVAGFLGKQMEN
jgi:stage V sporulation protein T